MTTSSPSARIRIPKSVRRTVIDRDGRVCQTCGRPVVVRSRRRGRVQHAGNLLTLDHIVPVSRGGRNEIENLRVCCRTCNMRRGSRP
jgi:5-methylcytosine-specific restriction endonuclease McrA